LTHIHQKTGIKPSLWYKGLRRRLSL
jgi:hypothetical protein